MHKMNERRGRTVAPAPRHRQSRNIRFGFNHAQAPRENHVDRLVAQLARSVHPLPPVAGLQSVHAIGCPLFNAPLQVSIQTTQGTDFCWLDLGDGAPSHLTCTGSTQLDLNRRACLNMQHRKVLDFKCG